MPVNARIIIKSLQKQGWVKVSQKGSHAKMKKGNLITIIPIHGGKDLKRGTIKAIEKQTGVSLL